MKKELVASIVAGFCLSSMSAAGAGGFSVAAKAGTLGFGVELTTNLLPDVNGRVGINTFNIDRDATENGIDYNIELEMQTVTGFVDWHPFATGFRTTLGLVVNGNELNMKAQSATSYEIGGTVYTPAQVGTLTGAVGFDSIAPYLGIGWGNAVSAGKSWSFLFDIGVFFQGEADISLNTDGLLATNAAFQADLEQEKQQLEQDLDDFKLYPVLAFGVSYKF